MASIHGIDIADNVKFFHRNFIVKGVIDLTAQYRNYGVADDFKRIKKISKDNKSFHHPLQVDTYDDPATFPVSPDVLAIFREEWRKLGPRHRLVDRWRFDLGWRIRPEVVRAFLEADYRVLH